MQDLKAFLTDNASSINPDVYDGKSIVWVPRDAVYGDVPKSQLEADHYADVSYGDQPKAFDPDICPNCDGDLYETCHNPNSQWELHTGFKCSDCGTWICHREGWEEAGFVLALPDDWKKELLAKVPTTAKFREA